MGSYLVSVSFKFHCVLHSVSVIRLLFLYLLSQFLYHSSLLCTSLCISYQTFIPVPPQHDSLTKQLATEKKTLEEKDQIIKVSSDYFFVFK